MIEVMKRAAVDAGKAILEIYEKDYEIEHKNEKGFESPLTEADLLADKIIVHALKPLGYPILTEEGKDDFARLKEDKVFIVDPLDGTKEFIKRNGEFTVNIGLAQSGRPVLGVIYVPVTGELYYTDGEDAYLDKDGKKTRLMVSDRKAPAEMVLVKSRSHASGKLLKVLDKVGFKDILTSGSSVKGCLVARGEADIYPCLHPIKEWDICAMDAIVTAAGGKMTDMQGNALTYNKEDVLFQGFVLTNGHAHKEIISLFR